MVDEALPKSDAVLVAIVARLQGELAEARAELASLWALLHSGAWWRDDDDEGGRTHLCLQMANGADLSCRAMREDAIRAALTGKAGA